jgi:hypothetical protein
MLIHEQFYTSAPELLDSTSSNLGVVAQTRGFPKELEGDLDSHRSYTLRSNDIRDPASCPPRFAVAVCGRQKSHVVISRVSFAGADHTGRTRPFAHHLAIRCDEMEREGVDLASFVDYSTRALRDKWDGPPTWLEPRSYDEGMKGRSEQVSPAWHELLPTAGVNNLLASVADGLVADPTSRHPVVLCIPVGSARAVLNLCADVLALLPVKVQAGCVCVSHVVEMADYLRDSALVFTYPETPFLIQCRQRQDVRRPLIVDLSNGGDSTLPSGPYAEALLSVVQGATIGPMHQVVRLWDECGLTPAQKPAFGLAIRLRERLAATPVAGDVASVASELSALSNVPTLRSHLENWSKTFLQGLLQLPETERWTAVRQLACDSRWPERIRGAAFDVLARHADASLPYTLNDGAAIGGQFDVVTRELGRRTASFPAVASAAVQLAVREPAERHLRFAAAAMEHTELTFASALQWCDAIGSGGDVVRHGLQSALVSQLTRTSRSREDFAALQERTKPEHPHAQFNRSVYCEVLRRHFSASPSDKTRGQLADWLMSAALQESSPDVAAKELGGLLDVHRAAITAQHVEAWLQRARGTPQVAALQRVATEAGLVSVAPPPPPEPPRHTEPPARRPAPPVPAFGEGGVRSKPMREGRARGVVPPTVFHSLFLFLIAGAAVLLYFDWFRLGRWHYGIVATIGIAVWLISVIVDLVVRSHPNRMGLAFGVRKAMTLVLAALLIFLAWPLIMWGCDPLFRAIRRRLGWP